MKQEEIRFRFSTSTSTSAAEWAAAVFAPRITMSQFIVKGKNKTVHVICGNPDCKDHNPRVEFILARKIRIEDNDFSGSYIDGRPRSPQTGQARMGAPNLRRISFKRTHVVWGCLSCQLHNPVVNERL